ncbi:MAG TPA: branched-chain amino acid ABC transporter permease [Halanaerobiales bacterium]|nr:branched-chain amino acid ABC transporter permease [Halanaerobiales bacterium]
MIDFLLSRYFVSIITFTSVTVIAVIGIYILTGLTGLFSLGHGAFMAIGAYVAGVLMVNTNIPFFLAVIIALLVSLIAGAVIALPCIKLRRDYIALVTFGFGEAITAFLRQTATITGGASGLSGIPAKTTPVLAILSVIVIIIIARKFKFSRLGRQCLAIRNDELAAKSMGINVAKVKFKAFMFSSAVVAYAGILYAFYTRYVDPGMFGWTLSAEWLIMVFVGGVNSLTGAVLASVFLSGIPEALRFAAAWRVVLYSLLILMILNFRPKGIFGDKEFSFKHFGMIKKYFKGDEGNVN